MSDESSAKRTRASGEVLDYLLREFGQNHNPSPELRKEISDRTNMSEKAVRIWFQNRRAKLRKFERMGKSVKAGPGGSNGRLFQNSSVHLSRSNLLTNILALQMQSMIPVELNEKYCFVDCSSLSVGSWQRIKSGHHDEQALQNSLINLSPFTLNTAMSNVDLTVILSRKNYEINYFFSAISNNLKILFRIFYPISSVLSCLLLDNNISKENNELRLNLSRKPKFSVYFFNGVNANLNQWSICDDFSEGQQVSSAYYAPGRASTPHVLVGVKNSLQFLNSFIMENIQIHHQQSAFAAAATSTIQGNDTPASNDYSVGSHNDLPVSTAPTSKDFMDLEDGAHGNGDFQIKHEMQPWEETTRHYSNMTNFEENSPDSVESERKPEFNGASTNTESLQNQKKPGEYDEMFVTHTPDFFNTVQTPSSAILNAHPHQEDENLIHSPSTNVTFGSTHLLEKNRSPPPSEISSLRFEHTEAPFNLSNFSEVNNQNLYNNSGDQHYDFALQQQGEFQPNDLIVNSAALSNATATPNPAAGHVDNFIDYNAHY